MHTCNMKIVIVKKVSLNTVKHMTMRISFNLIEYL